MMNQNTVLYLNKLNEYIIETEIMSKLYKSAVETKIPVVRKTTAKTLYLLCKMRKPDKILEIGTGSGYSTIWMNRGAPDAELTTIERDKNRYVAVKKLFNNNSMIIPVYGDFFRQPDSFYNQKFDFIFLDAIKREYPDYLSYMARMLNPNGILFTDNVTFGEKIPNLSLEMEEKYRGGVDLLMKFNEEIAKTSYFETLFLSVDDGIAVSLRNVKECP